MAVSLQIINPWEYKNWDDLVCLQKEYSFFHSSAWAQVICDSYNYNPLYFILINRKELQAVIPLVEVKSFLTGHRGVSLPFSDYCEPIMGQGIDATDVIDSIINYGKKAGWDHIEFKTTKKFHNKLEPSQYFYKHFLNLSENENTTFNSFHEGTRRNIKRAIKNGVTTCTSHSFDSVKEFYRLHCITRKRQGIPPQPFYFFENIFKHVISKKKGFIVLASFEGNNIAASVYFNFHKKAYFKYGAFDKTYYDLRSSYLVMWEAIRWFCQNGFESICFGRTDMKNNGLLQFKRGWGTEENIIIYYNFNLKNNLNNNLQKNLNIIFPASRLKLSFLPVSILKIIGLLFYKHAG